MNLVRIIRRRSVAVAAVVVVSVLLLEGGSLAAWLDSLSPGGTSFQAAVPPTTPAPPPVGTPPPPSIPVASMPAQAPVATPLQVQVPSPAAMLPTPFLTPVSTMPAQQTPPPATPATPATQPTAPPLQAFVEPTAATVPTIFTTFAGGTVTISEAGVAGASVQFQESTDLVTWVALATVAVDASGQATYTFQPVHTAYYRAYSYATGQLSNRARGIVVAFGQWTGYTVGGGPFGAVTGTFTVPNLVVPTATATVAMEWVGIDGILPNTSLIQAGVSESTAPGSDQVTFQPWWEILPDDPTIVPIDWRELSVLSGHVVRVTIWQLNGSSWEISLTDDTTGQTYTTPPQTYRGPGTSAEWIVEAPANTETGSVFTLGQFAPDVTFSNARFFDEPSVVERPVSEKLQPIVQAGVIVAAPSALSGDGFTVAYGDVSPPAP